MLLRSSAVKTCAERIDIILLLHFHRFVVARRVIVNIQSIHSTHSLHSTTADRVLKNRDGFFIMTAQVVTFSDYRRSRSTSIASTIRSHPYLHDVMSEQRVDTGVHLVIWSELAGQT